MASYIYKYELNDEIIYIGITDKLSDRLHQHGKPGDNIPKKYWKKLNSANIYYAKCQNRNMADVLESALIEKYKPICNVDKKNSKWAGLPLVEPAWIFWDERIKKELSEKNDYIKSLELKLVNLEGMLEQEGRRNDILDQKIQDFKSIDDVFEKYKTQFFIEQREACEACYRMKCVSENRKPKISYLDDSSYSYSSSLSNKEYKDKCRTLPEIIDLYKTNTVWIDYTSKSYDAIGKIECTKHVYTNKFGQLAFDFHCDGVQDASGNILLSPSSTSISNIIILNRWKCRGSQRYYPNSFFEFKY